MNLVLQPILNEAGLFNLEKKKFRVFIDGLDLVVTVLSYQEQSVLWCI